MLGWGRAEGLSDLRWSGPPSTWAQLGPIESLGDMEDVSLAGHVCSLYCPARGHRAQDLGMCAHSRGFFLLANSDGDHDISL